MSEDIKVNRTGASATANNYGVTFNTVNVSQSATASSKILNTPNTDSVTIKIDSKSNRSVKEVLSVSNSASVITVLAETITEIRSLMRSKEQIQKSGEFSSQKRMIEEKLAKLDEKLASILTNSAKDENLEDNFKIEQIFIPANSSAVQEPQDLDSFESSLSSAFAQLSNKLNNISQERKVEGKVDEDSAEFLAQKIGSDLSSPFNSITNNRLAVEASSLGLDAKKVFSLVEN